MTHARSMMSNGATRVLTIRTIRASDAAMQSHTMMLFARMTRFTVNRALRGIHGSVTAVANDSPILAMNHHETSKAIHSANLATIAWGVSIVNRAMNPTTIHTMDQMDAARIALNPNRGLSANTATG